MNPEALARLKETWKDSVQRQLAFRGREQVARFFAGTDLVEPGLVPVDEWRAGPGTADGGNPAMWAGSAASRRDARPGPEHGPARAVPTYGNHGHRYDDLTLTRSAELADAPRGVAAGPQHVTGFQPAFRVPTVLVAPSRCAAA